MATYRAAFYTFDSFDEMNFESNHRVGSKSNLRDFWHELLKRKGGYIASTVNEVAITAQYDDGRIGPTYISTDPRSYSND